MNSAILTNLQENKISIEEAYKEIFGYKSKSRKTNSYRKAHFIKFRVTVPDQKGVNSFLRVLFLFPFPLFLVKIILFFIKSKNYENKFYLTKDDLMNIISTKNININISASTGEKILIKTI